MHGDDAEPARLEQSPPEPRLSIRRPVREVVRRPVRLDADAPVREQAVDAEEPVVRRALDDVVFAEAVQRGIDRMLPM